MNGLIEGFRLSPQQLRLWSCLQSDPTNVALQFLRGQFLVEGHLDTQALYGALEDVIGRHEILRTTYPILPSMTIPVQVIADTARFGLMCHDLRQLPNVQLEDLIADVHHDFLKHSNESVDDIVQVACLTISANRHLILMQLPSLSIDTASYAILVRDIAEAYTARLRSGVLPEVELQYADLAEWLHELLASDESEAGRLYWQQRAGNVKEPALLPFVSEASHVKALVPKTVSTKLTAAELHGVETVAGRCGVTVRDLLLAAWTIVISRYTGDESPRIAVAADGRQYEELEQALGLFTRYLPLDLQVNGELAFDQWLTSTVETCHAAQSWQDQYNTEAEIGTLYGFRELQSASPIKTETATFYIQEVTQHMEFLDVECVCQTENDGLRVQLVFNETRVTDVLARRLLDALTAVLHQVGQAPHTLLRALEAVGHEERAQLLALARSDVQVHDWNTPVYRLIEQQAQRFPQEIAVCCADQRLTYGELNRKANRLAKTLQAHGVRENVPVGICLDQSVEMIIAIIAIHKAGGAFVPLDAKLPLERLRYMVQASAASLVLTVTSEADRLAEIAVEVLVIDTLEPSTEDESFASGAVFSPRNLAYILFTSGSTGLPKGVAVEQQQLTNYVSGILPQLGVDGRAQFALASTFAADLGHTMLFPALVTGGCLHVLTKEVVTDANRFADEMEQNEIEFLKIVPSHLKALLTASQPEQVLPRRLLVLGGEATSQELIDQIRQLSPTCKLLIHYGPTETTVGVLTYAIAKDEVRYGGSLPIGRPLPNVEAYILDATQRVVPFGCVGELYIGGASVARGYQGSPELTAERFLPHPFADTANARVYRTGDLVRYLEDGNVAFVGRADFQVKINGFRIELMEIEAVLASHELVEQAVVLAYAPGEREPQLLAFVATVGGELAAEDILGYAKARLPEYMVPAKLIFLPKMPLTSNGKIDRTALLDLAKEQQEDVSQYVEPKTPVEQMLAGIWQELLGREKVGSLDDFFALGGHSLLATQLISRIRKVFQVNLPLRQLFQATQLRSLADVIETLRRDGSDERPPILRVTDPQQSIPLSYSQKRMWVLSQFDQANPAYNMRFVTTFRGDLDVEALERAINEIARRHEIMRTSYHMVDGEMEQVINPHEHHTLLVTDLSMLTESQQEAEVERYTLEQSQKPFAMEERLMYRSLLLKLADDHHLLLITMHHIISDGWGMGVIGNELDHLYRAFAMQQPSPLPELPIQYSDYAIWQRRWLESGQLEKQMSYWKNKLAGSTSLLEIPTDHPRPAVFTYQGSLVNFVVPDDLRDALHALSRKQNTTLFMTLLAAFKVLLYRYSKQTDILIGTPIANRTSTETESLLGLFLNTLVLRDEIEPEQPFELLLAQVRDTALEAYDHQDLPFELLVEELQPQREMNHSPLFQVMFNFLNTPRREYDLPNVQMSVREIDNHTAKFDLLLSMSENAEGRLIGAMEYSVDLFEQATIERMMQQFVVLLQSVVEAPETPVQAINLLTEVEKQQLLVDFTDTERQYEPHFLHHFIEAQSERTPDQTAVVFQEHELSYRELNQQANQLAHLLISKGVGPDAVVAICVHRSIEIVIAYLAVLKAGGAILPLDPTLPHERLSLMLQDATPHVVLTQEAVVERLPETPVEVLALDTVFWTTESWSTETPQVAVEWDHLAYVIYTSGSTGVPKGVMNTHRGISNRLQWMQERYVLTGEDAVLQKTSISFDVSVWEFFWPLMYGAKLVLAERGRHVDVEYLIRLIREQSITTLHFVPSMLNLFLDHPDVSICTGLKRVICSGEALHLQIQERFYERFATVELHNLYGPTEAAIDVTHWMCDPHAKWTFVPIGRPIANTQMYILDEHMQPVPIGVPGELYIGGVNLARGYLNRPQLTVERFVPNPFQEGTKLYKTGDVARYRPSGIIEYLGRNDDQVKIRGYRIELGEVESVMLQHPSITAVGVAVFDDHGGKRLVAYVVPQNKDEFSVSELQRFLAELIPSYMVPSLIQTVEALPFTSSGKLNRKALPAPTAIRSDLEIEYVAPKTELERSVAAVWKGVLGVEQVGLKDNFFNLGGHSLLLIQVHRQLEELLERKIPLIKLFEYPTVSAITAFLEHETTSQGTSSAEGKSRAALRKEKMKSRVQKKGGRS